MHDLAQAILSGSRRALARALTLVENEADGTDALMAALYPHTGRAWVIGITGAPGTGKSSLVTALAAAYRKRGKTVGILAVDPTSPFTGGAILGDRIRMRELSGNAGVFIRSMATRGSLGGLARATRDAVRVMDAAGFDMLLVETVGAGQSEVEIVRMAHTTLVIEAPGLGDDVQAIKAGILEIADILVVNKADRIGADNTVRALRAMLELGHPTRPSPGGTAIWLPPVVKTIATRDTSGDDGIVNLIENIEAHRTHLQSAGQMAAQERERLENEIADRVREALYRNLLQHTPQTQIEALLADVAARKIDPRAAAARLAETLR